MFTVSWMRAEALSFDAISCFEIAASCLRRYKVEVDRSSRC
jgi:hypothetical protein